MTWFNFIKSEGYFEPDKNPEPILVEGGYQIPHWESLSYLDKLSVQFAEGKQLEFVDELLAIIKNVSEHPKDNYRTWYLFIKFLSRIPNDRIPLEIFHFIPIWLSGRFDTMLQTSELCEKVLPKFLNENPTPDDIKKAELICHYLIQIEKKAEIIDENIWNGEGDSYYSRTYLYHLATKFEKQDLVPRVAKYFSDDFYLDLGRMIKFLLLDYPKGIDIVISDGTYEYKIKIFVEKENLVVVSKIGDADAFTTPVIISDYEFLSEAELKRQLVSALQQQNIYYLSSQSEEDTFQQLNFALNNDLSSVFGFNSIRKLDDKYNTSDKVLNVFALILRDVLDEKAKYNPEAAIELLKIFCHDKLYGLPFFKRMAFYVISENWNLTKLLFWDLVKESDPQHFFSLYKYQKDLYELLNRNQQFLDPTEKEILQHIIDLGEKEEVSEKSEGHAEYWRLRWYAAMKDIEPFREKYEQLSKQLNITNEHFDNLGEIRFKSGSISPLSTDELLQKTNQEIADYIRSFHPKDRWEDPNISGLSDALGKVVEEQPEKFAGEIYWYLDVSYLYSYRILYGFDEAWKKQKTFDWKPVLDYCLHTLQSDKFYSGQLSSKDDGWGATFDWVVGAIANLLTSGLRNDQHALPMELLPSVKEIIKIVVSNLKRVDDFKSENMDYPGYSLNSTGGKCLRALLDYSLFRARHLFENSDSEKWDPEIRSLFEVAKERGIIDGYILEGWYFEQFYYLDKDWITSQVKQHYQSKEREWLAFMSGFVFSNAPSNETIYHLFYPHYERAIKDNAQLKNLRNNGLVRHLTAFYFWGYETLDSSKLIFKFLNSANPVMIGEFINFIWRQEDYLHSLSEIAKVKFQKIILELWIYLAGKFEKSESEEEQKFLASLANWIVFAPELNNKYAELVLKSCKYLYKVHATHELLKNLNILKKRGTPSKVARVLGEILMVIQFKDYITDFDQDILRELVSFMFAYGQESVASVFCNNMAAYHQQFFLRDIYEANVKR